MASGPDFGIYLPSYTVSFGRKFPRFHIVELRNFRHRFPPTAGTASFRQGCRALLGSLPISDFQSLNCHPRCAEGAIHLLFRVFHEKAGIVSGLEGLPVEVFFSPEPIFP